MYYPTIEKDGSQFLVVVIAGFVRASTNALTRGIRWRSPGAKPVSILQLMQREGSELSWVPNIF